MFGVRSTTTGKTTQAEVLLRDETVIDQRKQLCRGKMALVPDPPATFCSYLLEAMGPQAATVCPVFPKEKGSSLPGDL